MNHVLGIEIRYWVIFIYSLVILGLFIYPKIRARRRWNKQFGEAEKRDRQNKKT